MVFGDFEDGRRQPMEGGCWGLQSSPEASRKVAGNTTIGAGGPAGLGQREGGEKKREKVT